jgi:DNA-binding Lrp family transcriptional regulator
MGTTVKNSLYNSQVAKLVRQRIEKGRERFWRLKDFQGLSSMAVAQALSRLRKSGYIERVRKGIYYRARQTAFGKSRPNPAKLQKLITGKRLFPSGIAAANLLGFTTQNPNKIEVSTHALSLPRQLIGHDAIIHTRRPKAWTNLQETDAALLDFFRQGGKSSELSPEETIHKTMKLLSEDGRFERLLRVVAFEPPRVKAMLGALGEQLGKNPALLKRLRESLNPLSKFDFGHFTDLKTAAKWQAKT